MLLEQLTLKDLREIARQYNNVVKIAGYTKFSKEELITALNKHNNNRFLHYLYKN